MKHSNHDAIANVIGAIAVIIVFVFCLLVFGVRYD